MTTTINKKVGLGKTDEGYRVVLDVYYGPDREGNAERQPVVQSVEHEEIPYPLVLTITGELCDLSKRRSSPDFIVGIGQIHGEVRKIVQPDGSLTVDDAKRLADLWERWHLNTMRAACAHMDLSQVPDDVPENLPYAERQAGGVDRYTWIRTNLPCPVSDYKYGSAWLAENVPDEVVEEISNLIAKAQA